MAPPTRMESKANNHALEFSLDKRVCSVLVVLKLFTPRTTPGNTWHHDERRYDTAAQAYAIQLHTVHANLFPTSMNNS